MDHAFEDIEIMENAITLLGNSLQKKQKKYTLSTGSLTDPYIPLEMELGYMRKSLSLAASYGFGFTLISKFSRVLQVLDLLKAIPQKSKMCCHDNLNNL